MVANCHVFCFRRIAACPDSHTRTAASSHISLCYIYTTTQQNYTKRRHASMAVYDASTMFCAIFGDLRDDNIRMFSLAPKNTIHLIHDNLPFSYRNYKIFYEFHYPPPPPRFLVKMFSRNFSYQDKEKSEPVMPGAKISSTMSPQHSFTVLFSRNKKGRDRSYPQLRSLSFLFKPFISQYDCRTHHGNLSLLCYRHYSRAHVLLYDDRCLCQKCGLHGNDMPPELLRFPV